ncbi:MAG: hypothetical protein ACTFAK_11300 [Candidatus Electronema sp. VV]
MNTPLGTSDFSSEIRPPMRSSKEHRLSKTTRIQKTILLPSASCKEKQPLQASSNQADEAHDGEGEEDDCNLHQCGFHKRTFFYFY